MNTGLFSDLFFTPSLLRTDIKLGGSELYTSYVSGNNSTAYYLDQHQLYSYIKRCNKL